MEIKQDLLQINPFSRPGTNLLSVRKIVLHYVGNLGTTARQNVDWIKTLQNQDSTDKIQDHYASAHYFVDEKEIIQVIPDGERAYHVGANKYTEYGKSISSYPNARTIGIEFCHPDFTGRPEIKTYTNLLDLLELLCSKFNLDPVEDICLHHNITGKDCPKYYVAVPSEFYRLKSDVKCRMGN